MRQSGDTAPQKVIVMPGLVPGIHVLRAAWQGVDGRDRPGHDDVGLACPQSAPRRRSRARRPQ
ncbi:hypothetical protein D6B98_05105 [Bradyrhizobium sp. LVM 105]|uniref:Uncharacterized protein n=1 Tax=Bradyrhizobium frederickii TaxID=2560054 RepID=A0A4Y9KY99_9BRAD|nr:hypothetical protein D6B98_05105 [Bradyrhizobium sp. LVM 105]TFV34773.1 hypothetical protein E4K66_29550 [Bradyrhizobium frederickii]